MADEGNMRWSNGEMILTGKTKVFRETGMNNAMRC
jgi:hypothetical protein